MIRRIFFELDIGGGFSSIFVSLFCIDVMNKSTVAMLCLGVYILVAIWSGINPVEPGTWLVEVLTSLVPVILLVVLYFR